MRSYRVAWWKRMLSHFFEIPLESTGSDINEQLNVSLVRNRFQLSTRKSIYSYDDLYSNFYFAFQQIILPPDDTEILILGLGLGSIPFMLEKSFQKRYQYVTVELDESVIQLASKFSMSRLDSQIQIIHADAESFVKNHQQKYQLICVDLFIEDIVPAFFEGALGNNLIKNLLREHGSVLFNRLYRTGRDKINTDQFFEEVFAVVYEDPDYLEVEGNRILVGRG